MFDWVAFFSLSFGSMKIWECLFRASPFRSLNSLCLFSAFCRVRLPICLFFVEEKCLGILNWMIKFYKISMHGLIKYHWVDLKNELKKIFAMVVRLLLLSLIIDVWFSSISHLIGIYFFSVMVAELIKYYFPTWVRRFSPRVIPLDFEHVDLGWFA